MTGFKITVDYNDFYHVDFFHTFAEAKTGLERYLQDNFSKKTQKAKGFKTKITPEPRAGEILSGWKRVAETMKKYNEAKEGLKN